MRTIPRRHRLNRKDCQKLFGKNWKEYMRDIVAIDAQEAMLWMAAQAEAGKKNLAKLLPCVTPPWPLAWAQFDPGDKQPAAVLALSFPWENDGIDRLCHLARIMDRASRGKFESRLKYPPNDTKWITGLCAFVRVLMPLKAMDMWSPVTASIFAIGEDGAILHILANSHPEEHSLSGLVSPCLIAFAFSHCKNVIVEPSGSSRRKMNPHGEVRYRTLNIEAVSKRSESNGTGDGVDQAFHMVRGHFKDYREKGLFGSGKHHGIYWWDMHGRGDKKHGEIIKDYRIAQRT